MQEINILNLSDTHTWIWTIEHRKAGPVVMEWLDRMLIRHVFTTGASLVPIEIPNDAVESRDPETNGCTVFRFAPSELLKRECELVIEWLADVHDREPILAVRAHKMKFEEALEVASGWLSRHGGPAIAEADGTTMESELRSR